MTVAAIIPLVGAIGGGTAAWGLGYSVGIGVMIGALLGGFASDYLFPAIVKTKDQYGPRLLEGRYTNTSAYGVDIPWVRGAYPVNANVIWLKENKYDVDKDVEHFHDGESGGDGDYDIVTYSYSATFMISLCMGEIEGIGRIWLDGKLFADFRDPDGVNFPSDATEEDIEANKAISYERQQYFTLYKGTLTQTADADYIADVGSANASAYRGLAYMKIKDLPLEDYNDQIPSTIEVEIFADGITTTEDMTLALSTYSRIAVDKNDNLLCYNSTEKRFYLMDRFSLKVINSFNCPWYTATLACHGFSINPNTGDLVVVVVTQNAVGINNGWSEIIVCKGISNNVRYTWAENWVASGSGSGSVIGGSLIAFDDNNNMMIFNVSEDYYSGSWQSRSYNRLYDGVSSTMIKGLPALTVDGQTADWARGMAALVYSDVRSKWGFLHTGVMYWAKTSEFDDGGIPNSDTTAVIQGTDATNPYFACFAPNENIVSLNSSTEKIYFHDEVSSTLKSSDLVDDDPPAYSEIISDICIACGLTAGQIDVTALAGDDCLGYRRTRQMSGNVQLKGLATIIPFDYAEIDWKVVFTKRGQSSEVTILLAELAARGSGQNAPPKLIEEILKSTDFPTHLTLGYASKSRDYENVTQQAKRFSRDHESVDSAELPVVMTDTEAKRSVEIILKMIWLSKKKFKFSTTLKYLYLAINNVLTIDGKEMRIEQMDINAGMVNFVCGNESYSNYTSIAEAEDITLSYEVIDAAEKIMVNAIFLDLPPLDSYGNNMGIYIAFYSLSTEYKGGKVLYSVDAGAIWLEGPIATENAIVGRVTTAPGDGTIYGFDNENTIVVDMDISGETLSSKTEQQAKDGEAMFAIGNEDIGWEICSYSSLVDNLDDTYDLAGLLRGQRGTDHMTDQHTGVEYFVFLSGKIGIARQYIAVDLISTEILYKSLSIDGILDNALDDAFTPEGESITPFSIVHLKAHRQADDDVTIFWNRRDRTAFDGLKDYVDAPMSELVESYEIDVYDEIPALLRTIEASDETVEYTAAQQITDGILENSVDINDDCSGTFGTNWADESWAGANYLASFASEKLSIDNILSTTNGSYGGNAELLQAFDRGAGQIEIQFDWWPLASGSWYDDDLSDSYCAIFIVTEDPVYTQTAWKYHIPEADGNTKSYLALYLRSDISNLITVREQVNEAITQLLNEAFTYDESGGHTLKLKIDFSSHWFELYEDTTLIGERTSFNSDLDTYWGDTVQIVFHWHTYDKSGAMLFDNISVVNASNIIRPFSLKAYQLSDVIGRGYVSDELIVG